MHAQETNGPTLLSCPKGFIHLFSGASSPLGSHHKQDQVSDCLPAGFLLHPDSLWATSSNSPPHLFGFQHFRARVVSSGKAGAPTPFSLLPTSPEHLQWFLRGSASRVPANTCCQLCCYQWIWSLNKMSPFQAPRAFPGFYTSQKKSSVFPRLLVSGDTPGDLSVSHFPQPFPG